MSNQHYYSQTPLGKTQEQKHPVVVANHTLQLWTDHGVFSKTGLDFGSRVLIETICKQLTVTGKILDVGCGYGPIGISLARQFNQPITMVDVNERALALAQKNCAENHVTNATVQMSHCYDNVLDTDYTLIVSNPPIRAGKQVVHTIIEESKNHLVSQGQLVIVIQKKQGAPSAQKKMTEVFGNVTLLDKEKGYWILMSEKTE